MEVKKLKSLEKVIKPILEDNPPTREDDLLLYAEVLRRYDPTLLGLSVRDFLLDTPNVPNMKTVERVRRKLQAKFPRLASEKAKRKRAKEQATYISYAKDDDGEFW